MSNIVGTPQMKIFAPAKLNRFLHIVGRLPNGYHQLQTIFERLDYGDTLELTLREDDAVILEVKNDPAALKPASLDNDPEKNSVMKAVRLLQSLCAEKPRGIDIQLTKKIPVGAGLGGGSSDAASTLIALNQLWELHLPQTHLMDLALKIGADVPFFVSEQAASWAEGVGEQLTPIALEPSWFVVIVPELSIATSLIFQNPDLKRDTPRSAIHLNLLETDHNDCETVARQLYPELDEQMHEAALFAPFRLTGTGSCIFAVFKTQEAAQNILNQLPSSWKAFIAQSLQS